MVYSKTLKGLIASIAVLSLSQPPTALGESAPITSVTKEAPKKGTLKLRLNAWPKSFNAYTANSVYSNLLARLVHASLLDNSHENWDIVGKIAEKWEESDDKKELTFYLNKDAKFDSGNPVTAEDVKFSFDKAYNKKECITCEAGRSYIGEIDSITVVNPHKIVFKMKNSHFENLSRVGSLFIFEKKKFEKGDFNRDYDKVIEGAGPYSYDKKASKFRKSIVLRLNKDHWTTKLPYYKNRFNFKKIIFKYIEDDTVAFEAFKKKDLDIFYFEQGNFKAWDNKDSVPFTDKNMARVTSPKLVPWLWGGVALNMRSGATSDLKFRQALQLVLDRETFVSKLFNDHQKLVKGPFADGSKYSSNSEPTKYDPKKASKLLKEAGYVNIGSDGILYKTVDGKKQRASITIMYATNSHDQWMTMFKSDAKKVGIEVNPRFIDWSAGIKLVDEFNFEGFVIGWSGDPVPAPNQLWHGSTANNKGTSNLAGLNDPEVNKLIDEAPTTFDEAKRIELFKTLEKKILSHQPYLLRWTQKNHYIGYWKDTVDATSTPMFKFSGSDRRKLFYMHWHAAK